jgi:hypothetical protein
MILAGFVETFLGVKAERRSLEDMATPLTAHMPSRLEPQDRTSAWRRLSAFSRLPLIAGLVCV